MKFSDILVMKFSLNWGLKFIYDAFHMTATDSHVYYILKAGYGKMDNCLSVCLTNLLFSWACPAFWRPWPSPRLGGHSRPSDLGRRGAGTWPRRVGSEPATSPHGRQDGREKSRTTHLLHFCLRSVWPLDRFSGAWFDLFVGCWACLLLTTSSSTIFFRGGLTDTFNFGT